MKKIIISAVLGTVFLIGCPDVTENLQEYAKSHPLSLNVSVSAEADYIDEVTGIHWYAAPPSLKWVSEGSNQKRAAETGDTAVDVKVTVEVNGAEPVEIKGAYQLPEETGVYTVLFTATDLFGRTVYDQVEVGVDVDSPVIGFVNTDDTVNKDEIADFVDSVPDNAMSDNGSGLNLSSRRGYWESEDAVNAAGGDVINRIFEVTDNVGHKTTFIHPVTVFDMSNLTDIGGQSFILVKELNFAELTESDLITFSGGLSWASKTDSGLSISCENGKKHADSKIIIDTAALPNSYNAATVTWTKSNGYTPNFYIGDNNYGFVFCKSLRNPNCYFMKGNWEAASGTGVNVLLQDNQSVTVGFWEKPDGKGASFHKSGDGTWTLNSFDSFDRGGKSFVGNTLSIGIHSDGTSGSVVIEKITFYLSYTATAE